MTTEAALKTVLRRTLKGYSIQAVENQGLHSWRCQYPDKYGECKCFEELVDALTKAILNEEKT